MRIVMTTDAVGGVGTYARLLAGGLSHFGHEVTRVAFGPSATCPGDDEVVTAPFGLEWSPGAQREQDAACEWLHKLIKRIRPDVLHCNQYVFARCRNGCASVVVAHGDLISWWRAVRGSTPPPTAFYRWYRCMVSNSLDSADAVVSPSWSALDDLNLSFGYGSGKTRRMIYHGVGPDPKPSAVLRRPRVVSIARWWDPAKQLELLRRPDLALPVVLAGPLVPPDCVDQRLPTKPFRGELAAEAVRALLFSSTIYAGVSRYEPFGLAPLEAAWSGCALLLNDIPSFREVWGDAAIYFRTNDGEDLARQIARLAGDKSACGKMAAAAANRARKKYTVGKMVDAYLSLYRSL